jgi:PAS domain S-box-containing protein
VASAITDAIVTADPHGRITGWYGGAAKLFGFEAEEAVGQPLDIIVPGDSRYLHNARYTAVALGAPSRLIGAGPVEVEALRADGTTVPVELTLGRGEDEDGPFLVGVLRDVSARRQADERLRVAQARFTSAFEHAPNGMSMTTVDGRYLRVNRAFTCLLDVGHLETIDRSFEDFTHPDDVAAEREARERLLARASSNERLEKRMLHKGGHVLWVETSIALVRDIAGEPLHFLSQLRDIDEQRRARAELERSNRELGDLAAVASHDLRVPLQTVAGLLEVLRRQQGHRLDRDGLELVVHASDAIGRMQALIEALLRLARLDGGSEVTREPVDLAGLAERVLEGFGPEAAAVEVGELPVVTTDASLVGQVLQNLVANALRHADHDAPRVRVSARRRPGGWTVSVADNGTGVDPDLRERVFERFARGKRHGAAGLGLAICRSAVERLGGRIWIAEGALGGADVRFTLPDAAPARP